MEKAEVEQAVEIGPYDRPPDESKKYTSGPGITFDAHFWFNQETGRGVGLYFTALPDDYEVVLLEYDKDEKQYCVGAGLFQNCSEAIRLQAWRWMSGGDLPKVEEERADDTKDV